MMPTSGQLKVVPVATPPEKLPKMAALLSAGASPPAGATRFGVSVTAAGDVSRPKFGVAAPAKLVAVTVAENGCPAWMKAGPAAEVAPGLLPGAASEEAQVPAP